jgi:crotonobetainyl-CoA hydratase
MDAQEAARWGLVNEVVPAADLLPRAHALATMLAEGPPLVFAAIKEVAREAEAMPFNEAIAKIMRRGFPTVARLYESEDQLEGARAFAEKRAPVWKGK